ncbi:uncharacterized protein LOC132628374 [Lycium barbarum]|uniref:uncharacterized protein LOC132628374 n=1 Tax=Lycium barbarum TaxID=112863 RepID=UPI00293E91BE|nr:uncharacterized protein LOC132628374 [Lycium barbarum]
MPLAGGCLNLANLTIWNKAATAKMCWDLEHKQDKLWIKWIHSYYIKGQDFNTYPVPQQACWMTRKIMSSRVVTTQLHSDHTSSKSLIRQGYLQLLGDYPRMEWKRLMFKNDARPKDKFMMWLHMHGVMRINDRLIRWGMEVNPECAFCQLQNESREHLFMLCYYTKALWNRVMQWSARTYTATYSWGQYVQWAVQNSKEKSQDATIFKLVFAEVVNAIWLERNARVFEKRRRHWEALAREVAFVSCVRASVGSRTKLQQLHF